MENINKNKVSLHQSGMIAVSVLLVLIGLIFILQGNHTTLAQSDPDGLPPDPPQPPLPNECLSSNLTPTIVVDQVEDDALLPLEIALYANGSSSNINPQIIHSFFSSETYIDPETGTEETLYTTNFEFNINDYYCDVHVDSWWHGDWNACWQGTAEAPDWIFEDLWPELIDQDFGGDVGAFKSVYVESDGFVGNYGVHNSEWLESGWSIPCWPFGNPYCGLANLPSEQSVAECQNALASCWEPYFDPDLDNPQCPKAPPPPWSKPGIS